uniref:Uncharacterized protein n=1 Tax=Anopheles darlingi TaxID=43151 RepID=A0A2M4DD62_ANODA
MSPSSVDRASEGGSIILMLCSLSLALARSLSLYLVCPLLAQLRSHWTHRRGVLGAPASNVQPTKASTLQLASTPRSRRLWNCAGRKRSHRFQSTGVIRAHEA